MRKTVWILAAVVLAVPAAAQTAPEHITGVIAGFAAPVLTVTTANGPVEVSLMPDARIIANQKSRLAAIKPNDFIASAAATGADGKLQAAEVRIFPEALRGLGEGQYPMATPDSSMTNATVVAVAGAAKGKFAGTLKLSFHGAATGPNGTCWGHASAPGKGACTGQTEIEVGRKTPVLLWVLGDTSWLVPGKAVSLFALTGGDAKRVTHGVVVERDGVKPQL